MDEVFKALADPSRRALLDALFAEDGQSLSALEARLPMTRFGVAKHLKVLEQAGLVTSRKVGRERLHHLNPVPLQQIQERWVSKYAERWSHALLGLKTVLEEGPMSTHTSVYELYIRTTPERLWQAITDGELTRQYYFGSPIDSEWTPGARFEMTSPDGGEVWVDGELLEVDPPRRLVQTFQAHWNAEMDQEEPSRVTWEIEQRGDACRLRVTHEGLSEAAARQVGGGWPQILSGLKTLLETGEPLALAP
ncbi:MAG TPA: metalloregulator ArsR/SmtB family transcription factor [Solirubrobacteraceae bacterium]|nr:metalloregulator ArsR/SmtB family transcription factor [Solirubrobacteraceae bacterium]